VPAAATRAIDGCRSRRFRNARLLTVDRALARARDADAPTQEERGVLMQARQVSLRRRTVCARARELIAR
jgi:hypothetical protein